MDIPTWSAVPSSTVTSWSAIAFAVVVTAVVAFHVALARGAPARSYATPAVFPGRFLPRLRVAAVAQSAMLVGGIAIGLSAAGVMLEEWSDAASWLIWGVVGAAMAAVIVNVFSPSAGERRIWVPVTALVFLCSLEVALSTL